MTAISDQPGLSLAGYEINLEQLSQLPASEQAEIRDQLLLLEAEHKKNPLLGYRPHPKQVVFHSPPFPDLRAFFGGNRSGKSTAATVDGILQAVDADAVPAHLKPFKRWEPPFHCRFVTPDLGHSLEGVVLRDFRRWCPADQLKGGSFDRAYEKQLRLLWFKNGSWIQFLSNEMDLDKFGGASLHRISYDEEPRKDIRDEGIWRLVDYDGEEIFAMTPLNGMSFMFDEVYDPWEQGKLNPAYVRVVLVDIDENPHLNERGRARALAKAEADPLQREARKSGRFVSFEGLVYPEFGDKHIIPDLAEIPAGVECFEGIDPGQRHMAAVLFCFLDEHHTLTVYDEIALKGKTVAQVCKQIELKRAKWKVHPRWTVIDPSARNKSHQTGRSDQQEYADHGIFTIPGQNARSAGLNRVKERLEAKERLRVCACCRELRAEFRRYRWSKPSSRSENESPEQVVKRDDHLLDVLRYICMQRPLPPPKALREQTVTMRDRAMRAELEQMGLGATVNHPSGPGIWA